MKQVFSLVLLTASLLLSACASDPYPYPPQFVAPGAISEQLLPPPPAPDSKRYQQALAQIIARQAKLTTAQKSVLVAENHITPEMIVTPTLGEQFSAERYPELYALLSHAASDAWRIADLYQAVWHTTRPWMADSRVALLVPKITSSGYPSGHTTTNTVWAYVLSDLFPGKRQAFFARAHAIGMHRVDGGAHFPYDVEAGETLAAALYPKMKQNPEFMEAFAAAQREIDEMAHSPALPHGRLPKLPKRLRAPVSP